MLIEVRVVLRVAIAGVLHPLKVFDLEHSVCNEEDAPMIEVDVCYLDDERAAPLICWQCVFFTQQSPEVQQSRDLACVSPPANRILVWKLTVVQQAISQ